MAFILQFPGRKHGGIVASRQPLKFNDKLGLATHEFRTPQDIRLLADAFHASCAIGAFHH